MYSIYKEQCFSQFWVRNQETFVSEVGNRSTAFVIALREVSSDNAILPLEGRNFLFLLPQVSNATFPPCLQGSETAL